MDETCRWKKEKIPEHEEFSDEESDEEDSAYEEAVIPRKQKRPEKRKLKAEKPSNVKRINPNPNPRIRIPKKQNK